MIRNIIFDFDGVLVDSEKLVASAFCKYLKNFNINFTEKEFSAYAGKKTIQVIEDLSNKFQIENKNKFFEDIMNMADEIFKNELTAIKDVKTFLKNTQFNCFIGSNSVKKRIIFGLKKVGLDNFFAEDKIFSFDMVQNPKPAPDIYLKAINSNSLNKNETIILEDSYVGVQAGVAAKVKVLGITAGGHWYENRSTQELLDAGAYKVASNYKIALLEIEKL